MTGYALGLDGGGTQCRALVLDLAGNTVGHGAAGPCSLSAVPPAEALGAALLAADTALTQTGGSRTDVRSVCAGVAGASFTDRRAQFLRSLEAAFPSADVTVEPDYATALWGATGGAPGVIVIAGTGSAAYGENAEGETHRTGAYGYLVDDSGSGYGVGRGAIAAVLRAADGTGPQTTLTGRILGTLGLSSWFDIVPGVYSGAVSRVQIAGLSRVVAEAALDDGDETARALLMGAGGTLARLAHGVTQRLFADTPTAYPVVQVGGLWNAGEALTDIFARSLRRFAPAAIVSAPLHSPVEGAARWALDRFGASQKFSPPT